MGKAHPYYEQPRPDPTLPPTFFRCSDRWRAARRSLARCAPMATCSVGATRRSTSTPRVRERPGAILPAGTTKSKASDKSIQCWGDNTLGKAPATVSGTFQSYW